MPRSYSEKFLLELSHGDPKSLGVRLGRLCVDANLPAVYVAAALEVSRMTIYGWFRGRGISEKKARVVEVFMDLVSKDMAEGVLPAKNIKDGKRYVESLLGITI